MNYLGILSLSPTNVCEPMRKLTSSKGQINLEKHIYNSQDSAKNIITNNVNMSFYIEKEQWYIETDALGAGLGINLLQVRDGMQFPGNEAPDDEVLQPTVFATIATPKEKH